MANTQHSVKMFPMISTSDITTLKEMKLIGKVKRGLVAGTVLVFKNAKEVNGFVVTMQGEAKAKLLRSSELDKETLLITAKNTVHTLYKSVPVNIDLDPLYSEEELAYE